MARAEEIRELQRSADAVSAAIAQEAEGASAALIAQGEDARARALVLRE